MIQYAPDTFNAEAQALQRIINRHYVAEGLLSLQEDIKEDGLYGDITAKAVWETGLSWDRDGKFVHPAVIATAPFIEQSAMVSWVLANLAMRTPYKWGGQLTDGHWGNDCSGLITDGIRMGFGFPHIAADPTYDARARDLQISRHRTREPGMVVTYDNDSHIMVYIGFGVVCGQTGGGSSTTLLSVAKTQGARVEMRIEEYRAIKRSGWLLG